MRGEKPSPAALRRFETTTGNDSISHPGIEQRRKRIHLGQPGLQHHQTVRAAYSLNANFNRGPQILIQRPQINRRSKLLSRRLLQRLDTRAHRRFLLCRDPRRRSATNSPPLPSLRRQPCSCRQARAAIHIEMCRHTDGVVGTGAAGNAAGLEPRRHIRRNLPPVTWKITIRAQTNIEGVVQHFVCELKLSRCIVI